MRITMTNMTSRGVWLLLAAVATACAPSGNVSAQEEDAAAIVDDSADAQEELATTDDILNNLTRARARFITIDGEDAGVAELVEGTSGVLITLDLTGLEKGWRSFHIHETGSCEDDFKASGGHLNPSSTAHGLLHPAGAHAGDLPNINAHYKTVRAEMFTDRVSLTGAYGRPNLFDEDGSAFVIHENPDDHLTQPTGGGGARIACAVIKAVE